MATTVSLRTGIVESLVQNTVYALPPERVLLFTDASSPTIKYSTTQALTASVTLTLGTNGTVELGGGFIELTSTGPINVVLTASKG